MFFKHPHKSHEKPTSVRPHGLPPLRDTARLLGLDMPQKLAITDPDGAIPLEAIRRVMERVDAETVDVTPEPAPLPLDHKRQ